jgi:uncharacterized protein (DUF697 family)
MKEFQDKFIQLIIPVFESAIEERKMYYENNPKPTKEEIQQLIDNCSLKNGAISGLTGMVPGPAGLLLIIPDLKMTLENQIAMIYDIGVANDKEEHMTKEMVLSLAMRSGAGAAGISALARQGEKILIKRASVKAFKEVAKALGIKLSAGVIKSSVAKFVPVLGGIAIGLWVKYTTSQLGDSSAIILDKDLHIIDSDTPDEFQAEADEKIEVTENKVLILMNLMKADGNSEATEKEFINQIIDASDFSYFTKGKLKVDLQLAGQSEVDFGLLASAGKSSLESLLIDMVALAKRDGNIHPKEFSYIMEVCQKLNLDTRFVIDELGANYMALKYLFRELVTEGKDVLILSFNGAKNEAQFYTNNRVFIYEQQNQILKKGSYSNGGRRIRTDDGRVFEGNNIVDNLYAAIIS